MSAHVFSHSTFVWLQPLLRNGLTVVRTGGLGELSQSPAPLWQELGPAWPLFTVHGVPRCGIQAACPQLLTVLPLCARRAVILPYADSVPFLQLCDV